MFVVWAVVEFAQFLRKRPFPQRMRTGAYWGVGFSTLAALGGASTSANTWIFLATSIAIYGVGAAIIYSTRIIFTKIWRRSFKDV